MAGELINVDVKGLKELNEFLKRLPEQVQRKALQQSVKAGAQVLRDSARGRIPIRREPKGPIRVAKTSTKGRLPGFLRASIGVWWQKNNTQGVFIYGVGTRGYAYYGKFLEFGTKYISPRPFLRPALDSAYLWAIEAMASVLKRKVEVEIAKQMKAPT